MKLINLWDMIQIYGLVIIEALRQIESTANYARQMSDSNAAAILPKENVEAMRQSLYSLYPVCDKLELKAFKHEVQLLDEILKLSTRCASVLDNEFHRINVHFRLELSRIGFVFMPLEKSKYFEQQSLFGEAVFKSFPSTRQDIKAAGNSFAADLSTAAVFHLMRAANIAMRILARSVGVQTIGGKELEYCGDGSIIESIQTAVDSKLNQVNAHTVIRDEKWEVENGFYRRVKTDLEYFKDVVRDPISHARKTYMENGAIDVFDHVGEFLNRLASKGISE